MWALCPFADPREFDPFLPTFLTLLHLKNTESVRDSVIRRARALLDGAHPVCNFDFRWRTLDILHDAPPLSGTWMGLD